MNEHEIGSAIENDVFNRVYAHLAEHDTLEGLDIDDADMKELLKGFAGHMNLMPCGLFRYEAERDSEQRFSYVSRSTLRLLGYSSYAEFNDKFHNSFINLVYEQDRERVMNEIYDQVSRDSQDYCEYRIECADGHLMWVFDRGSLTVDSKGKKWFYVVIMDADSLKQEQMKVAWQQEERLMLMHTPGTTTYDYDPENDIIELDVCDENGEMRHITKTDFIGKDRSFEWLDPKSQEVFRESWDRIMRQGESGYYDISTSLLADDFEWHRITYRCVRDNDGKVYRVVGRADNIYRYMTMVDGWRERALHDSLTGLNNRASFMHSVRDMIKLGTVGSLLIIDIDKFKSINDTYGHAYGDKVLKDFSTSMLKLFRGTDFLGRYGGDEFLGYLPSLVDVKLLKSRLNAILEGTREIGKSDGRKVSVSIGATLYNGESTTLKKLIEQADKALYESKDRGGDSFTIYGEN